jgi:hypothetical protein
MAEICRGSIVLYLKALLRLMEYNPRVQWLKTIPITKVNSVVWIWFVCLQSQIPFYFLICTKWGCVIVARQCMQPWSHVFRCFRCPFLRVTYTTLRLLFFKRVPSKQILRRDTSSSGSCTVLLISNSYTIYSFFGLLNDAASSSVEHV